MTEGLLIVFIPMFLGYLIKTQHATLLNLANKTAMFLVYAILFIMGVSLGQLDDVIAKLPLIGVSALTFTAVICLCNIIGLISFDKLNPAPTKQGHQVLPPRWKLLLDSAKLCSMVVIGFVIGFITKGTVDFPFGTSTYALVILIFCVGIQLRNNGISLREVLFNKRGIYTGLIMVATSLFGGIIAALLLNLPVTQGLAISSGLGWYSLSSVVINNAWGPEFGSIAFFNDLTREILSLFIIPLFMRNYRSTAVGIAGATALDCTLPIIQRAGGIDVVPLAISFGFVTNILPPILLVFFSSIPL
ncbi:hypothetical protein A4G18_00355 [Pasteurellaceae bacterium Pebbles2]|nr:hypothetical protein [Pasteurellaceae bacterium Pebbles2]